MAAPDVTSTVYSLYYPETRRIVDELWSERPHAWYEQNYSKKQDAMHRGCLDGWRAWAASAGVKLGDGFAYDYPTAGASEAIHALLALHAARGGKRIHVFQGEYEGYFHIASALGLEVITHPRDLAGSAASIAKAAAPGDQFWLSQPSAIDGNLWPGFDAFRDALASSARGVDLIVDLTYVGAVAIESRIDLTMPPVSAILWSLSKPFGVYYHRIGGLLSRSEVPTLRGYHWFKNLFSLQLGERLMATYGARELPTRYKDHQRRALDACRASGSVDPAARCSDVVMLAHAPPPSRGAFADFTRGEGLRFCLSPTLDRMLAR